MTAFGPLGVLFHDLLEKRSNVVQPGVLRVPDILSVVMPGFQ
jgi:hypothetical protein